MLTTHHDTLRDLMADYARVCAGTLPDPRVLAPLRWQIAQAGRARMDYLHRTVFPTLDRCAAAQASAAYVALRDGTPAYQRFVSEHIARWTSATIAARWSSYRPAAARFRDAVMKRHALEAAILPPLLAEVAAPR